MVNEIFIPTFEGVFIGFDFSILKVELNEEDKKGIKLPRVMKI